MTVPLPLRVLLVEDNPADARLLGLLMEELRSPPVELSVAPTLGRALEELGHRLFDVVLLDLSLPDALGTDTVTKVRAARPELPLIVLTGLDDDETAVRALGQGAQDYLVKGKVDPQLLSRAMRYAMGRKGAEEDARRLEREQAARREAEAATMRARLLAEAAKVMAASLELEGGLQAVAELTVPLLADVCLFDVSESDALKRVALAAHGALPVDVVQALRRCAPGALLSQHAAGRVLEGAEVSSGLGASSEEQEAWRALGPVSAVERVLAARGRVVGRMVLARREGGFPPEGLVLADSLADRVALAADNVRLYKAREEMLGIVSHDLRNPLNVLRFAAEALRKSATPEQRGRQLERIDRTVSRMDRLIQDLLDVSRIEAGSFPIEARAESARSLAEEAVESLRAVAKERCVTLTLALEEPLPHAQADRHRVLQLFSNLLGNALKFTPEGGRVQVSGRRVGSELHFEVSDSGEGIPEGDLQNIFERFWQGARARRQGAGLGLAIARAIVVGHGGRIWVRSKLGEGSTFGFSLPLAEPLRAVEPGDEQAEGATAPLRGAERAPQAGGAPLRSARERGSSGR